jgi:hypothetical protein
MRNMWIYRETRALLHSSYSSVFRVGFRVFRVGFRVFRVGFRVFRVGSGCSGRGSGCSGRGSGFYRHPKIFAIYVKCSMMRTMRVVKNGRDETKREFIFLGHDVFETRCVWEKLLAGKRHFLCKVITFKILWIHVIGLWLQNNQILNNNEINT